MSKIQEFISADIVKNLGQELVNALGKEVSNADTSLYERKTLNFRDIIDNNFPTMLIVDYDNIRQELKQYQDIETALKTYIDKQYSPTEKDYKTTKFSDKEIELILSAIRKGVSQIAATSISYKELEKRLREIYDSSSESQALSKTRLLFNKIYKLSDNFGNTSVFIFPNFARIGDILRKPLDSGLAAAEFEAEQEIRGLDSIGSILAYGHTAAGYVDQDGNAVLKFNSPKLLAVMFDVMQSSQDSAKAQAIQTSITAATSFVEDTKQTEVFLSIDKDFSEGFVRLFVRIGGNIVRFENSLVNSRRGSVLEKKEKRGVNKAVLDRLATSLRNTSTVLGSRIARYITNKKSSPNLVEYVQHIITSTIKGEPVASYKGKSAKDTSKITSKINKEVTRGIIKGTAKLPKLVKPKIQPPKYTSNLSTLQNLLNANLVEKIKQNMGDGSRRDILNLRSGRFAESVSVERLSESRQGMITAFYTYMKNPYATFSQGGKQSSPTSRDPKLLISKSIREIAQQQVANRLRAVSI